MGIEWKDEYIELMYPSNMNNRREKKARKLKCENIPNSLYKYRTVNLNSIRSLRRNEVWCNSASNFNDPYECALLIGDYAEESLKALMIEKVIELGTGKLKKNLVENLGNMDLKKICTVFIKLKVGDVQIYQCDVDQIYDITKKEYDDKIKADLERDIMQIREKMKISCFSEVHNSILMWSHYADNHKGFCIEYNFNEIDINSNLISALQPTIYSDEIINIGEHLKRTPKKVEKFKGVLEEYAAIIKSNEWIYEQEWRIVFRENKSGGFNCKGLYPKAIYLGSRISEDDKIELLEIAREKKIPVYQMKTDNNKFELFAEKL
ncbi:DUF2971 domain-containing protein [Bacillus cereus]|uniref:DUF2971 domain-containing protein n=1 Tax=Bacillus cereus TaxID=1396 RepID=UPI0013890239|nr:hypothetical protein [Bacillus cereus]